VLKNLLFYRLLIVNTGAILLMAWGFTTGYIQNLVSGEIRGLPYAMAALFLVGFVSTFIRASKVSSGLNTVKSKGVYDASKIAIKNAHIGDIGSWLVTLGLIGNIVGFTMAVSKVDLSGGPDQAMAAIGAMMDGMKFAFNNTLIGTALGLWTLVNARMLSTATALLEKDATS
jgi:hypothetical protein